MDGDFDDPGDLAWMDEEEPCIDIEPEDDMFYQPTPGEDNEI